tara:strand:+ start:531 stop:2360 length:1830 start_codon:yes stop_codon:yes gene_type:complete
MASMQKTYTGDLTTAITQRLLSAYFGFEDRNYISQGKGGSNVSGTDPMVGGGGGGRGPINPEIVNSTPFDGLVRRPSVVNTSSSPGIVVHDRLLGNFLAAVSISLSSSINSLNQKADETTEGIEVAKDGISQTYKKLEHSSDTLENKLDAIIDALRYSNNQERKLADERETSAKKTEQKMATDMSSANQILMQDMDNEEIRQMREDDLAEDDRGPIVNTPPQNPDQMNLDLPEFAEGGIASGPDSGYLAVLHGDEAVIPLDNNYTQGQPSAIGQKPIANMPMMAERGTDNSDSMTPTFRPNISMASPPSISLGSRNTGGSGAGDMLAKAIQLPSKAAGLVTMGLMNKVLRTENISPIVAASLKSMSSPIASAFGIPDVMSSNIIDQEDGGREKFKGSGGGKRRRQKGLFGRFVDFILGRREEPEQEGTGGSLYGRGGSTTYNRMSVNGTGGYGYGGWPFGGKKPSDSLKELRYRSDHPLGTEQPNPFKPGSTLYRNFEKMREMDRYGVLDISSSGGDSQFFAKNVTYDNAYDYLNSPNYGLRTSEIAYNMSMQDEVNSMVDGLADPESQVVMNNANVNKDGGDQQIEYSAIAVRGNPLKDGTYISPYAV